MIRTSLLLKPGAGLLVSRRFLSSGGATGWNCCILPERTLIKVQGIEAAPFLQGLMTNDIEVLVESERKSLYCAFLNIGGRILFDAIISKTRQENEFLLDVDKNVANMAKKHLTMYKVRRKLTINASDQEAVYAVFSNSAQELDQHNNLSRDSMLTTSSPEVGSTYCDGGEVGGELNSLHENCLTHPDPRLGALGHRLILSASEDPLKYIPSNSSICDPSLFVELRCHLGIAEGVNDIPVGKCFPLEYNLDYLHGVNFHKGCYIGQELTARIHHTGVIRKRILPLKLSENINKGACDQSIANESGKSVGKVRALHGVLGLGLIRLKEAFSANQLLLDEAKVTVNKPMWWPPSKDNKISA